VRVPVLALVLAGALLLVACGGSADDSETVEGENVVVQMYDNRYQYTEIRIPVGGSVSWVGAGANPHNAVDANGLWSTEDVFGSLDQYEGDEAKLTYEQAGRYVFNCTYHGNAEGDGMAGVLIVGDES
jgi:plastocyanin